MTAAVGGALALALPFGRLRAFRIATGDPVSMGDALPTALALLPLVAWAAVALLSLSDHSRVRATARGLVGGGIIVLLAWLSGVAAEALLPGSGTFARYSVGAGVWLSGFFGFMLVVGSRREAGTTSLGGIALTLLPVVGVGVLILTGRLSSLGIAAEYRNVSDEFWVWFGQHVLYSVSAMAVAVVLGVALGVLAFLRPRFAEGVFAATSLVQTIPGLALIGILAVPLGYFAATFPWLRALGVGVLGWAPVVIALTLYALLAVVRNTYAGLRAVPPATIEAGRGMGMTDQQLLRRVEVPLAAPIVFSGIRTAFQQTIGNATLAVFVAAGALGRPIFQGVAQQAFDLVLLGSIVLVLLALSVDVGMRAAESLIVLSRRSRRAR